MSLFQVIARLILDWRFLFITALLVLVVPFIIAMASTERSHKLLAGKETKAFFRKKEKELRKSKKAKDKKLKDEDDDDGDFDEDERAYSKER